MGTGGGAALWWDTINHFKVKGSKVLSSPLEGRRQAPRGLLLSAARGFPAAARRRGSSAALRRSHFPGAPARPHSRARFTELAGSRGLALAEKRLSLRTGRLPARETPGVRFSLSQQAGKACTARLAERGRPGGTGPPRNPSSLRPALQEGAEESASKPSWRRAVRIPQKSPSRQHLNLSKDVALPFLPFCGHPSCPLPATRPGPHLRPCQGPSHRFSSPPPLLNSISSLTFPRPRLG